MWYVYWHISPIDAYWVISTCGIYFVFDGRICWQIYGSSMANKCCILLFLADLAKWLTQHLQLGCGIIILHHCQHWQHHYWHCHCLCKVILATSLMGTTLYVAYLLGYFPHWCILSNVDMLECMWHSRSIFVAGTYMAIAWYVKAAICCFLIRLVMWGLYVDYSSIAVGIYVQSGWYMCPEVYEKMWNECKLVFLITLVIAVSSYAG